MPARLTILRSLAPLAATLACALLASCSSVEVRGDPDFRFSSEDSYAWRRPHTPGADEDAMPIAAMRRAFERELGERGLQMLPRERASLLLDLELDVSTTVVSNDPYFDLYSQERREDGIIRLSVREAASNTELWSGKTRVRLRYAAHSTTGAIGGKWVDHDARRDWRVREVAERLLAGR